VTEGNVCGCQGCQNAAISQAAQATWTADRARIQCPPVPPTPCPAFSCIQILASCGGGRCTARRPVIIDAASYDTTCRTDSDCKTIYTGEVCSACKCATAAVNTAGFAQYQKDIAGVACTPGPMLCDCVAIGVAHCKVDATMTLGTCTTGP
jgi:hypothetical protein